MPTSNNETAVALHNSIIQFRTAEKKDEWILAQKLYTLRRYELWRFAVGGYDSWEDYLKQPEIGISRHKADKLVRIYEFFIVNDTFTPEDLKDVPWQALDYISKKNFDKFSPSYAELIEAAKHLTPKDFKERYFELSQPEVERTYSYVIMRKCDQTGNLEKVHEVESEQIKKAFNL